MAITPLKELPLSHDFMFGEVMRQEKVCKLFLEALLQKDIAKIEYIDRQKDFSDEYRYHGIRLDVYLEDKDGTVYNIEMQNTSNDDLPRRARYYQSGIDRRLLEKGVEYVDLKESFVIFVCAFDPCDAGFAIYERQSVIRSNPDICYDDGSHVIFLNSRYKTPNADDRIIEFLEYLKTNDDQIPFSSELMKEVRSSVYRIRNDSSKEEKYMTMEMKIQDVRRKSLQEGREEGIKRERRKNILALADAFSPSEISKRFQIPLKEVEEVLEAAAGARTPHN